MDNNKREDYLKQQLKVLNDLMDKEDYKECIRVSEESIIKMDEIGDDDSVKYFKNMIETFKKIIDKE